MGYSDELLGFDCGGQQWVLEVCFPTGTLQCAGPIAPCECLACLQPLQPCVACACGAVLLF